MSVVDRSAELRLPTVVVPVRLSLIVLVNKQQIVSVAELGAPGEPA